MKKVSILLLALFTLTACSNTQNPTEQAEKELEALMAIVSDYNDGASDIKAEYNEDKQCMELSWECETFTVSYDMHFKDLLTENPTSYADGFRISMVLFYKDVTNIDRMEFDYEGIKYKMMPRVSDVIDERGCALAGFFPSDEPSIECLKMLSNLSGMVTGKIYTNKGPIDIPLKDVNNLRGMARSYLLDGGKFE